MGKLIAAAALLLLVACQTVGGTFCDIAKPHRFTAEQVDMLTDAQVAEMLAHNRKGERLCGWKPQQP